jgi:hypothetical protein
MDGDEGLNWDFKDETPKPLYQQVCTREQMDIILSYPKCRRSEFETKIDLYSHNMTLRVSNN